MSDFSDRPLVAGSLIGTRSFRVDKLGRLTGVTHREVWRPGLNEAECLRGQGFSYGGLIMPRAFTYYLGHSNGGSIDITAEPETKKHQVASLDCACGFYAYTDTDANPHHEDGNVMALVEASGVATVGTRGFRAEKARIVALVAPKRPALAGWWDRYCLTLDGSPLATSILAPVGMASGILAGALLIGSSLLALGIAALIVGLGGGVASVAGMFRGQQLRFDREDHREPLSAEAFALVQRAYPDVPVFPSLRAALDRFPLSAPPEPTPDDEDFWTRSI